MRKACAWLLAGVSRQVSPHVPLGPSVPVAAAGAQSLCAITRNSPAAGVLPSWLASCLLGPLPSHPCGGVHGTTLAAWRSLRTASTLRFPNTVTEGSAAAQNSRGNSSATASPTDPASPDDSPQAARHVGRGKAPRHSRPPQTQSGTQQPASRSAKEKGAKSHGAKASSAAAAAKHGSTLPLPRSLEQLVAAIPVGGARGTVSVVGYHFMHPLTESIMKSVAQSIRDRPPSGVQVAELHVEEDRMLLLLRACEPGEAGEAAGSAEGGKEPSGPVSAVVLHNYGGVACFNTPDEALVDVLRRLAGALLHPGAAAGQPPPQVRLGRGEEALLHALAGGRRGGSIGELLQEVADKLCKEEQMLVINPDLAEQRRRNRDNNRWIKKDNNLYHLREWDSTNLESIAQGVTKSAALRYQDVLFEQMLDRYEEVVPLVEDDRPEQSVWRWASQAAGSLLRPRRQAPGKEPLVVLRQLVDKMTVMRAFLFCRLRVSEGPWRTWDSDRHYAVWEALRHEYELEDRLEILMDKADLLKQSCLDRLSANNSTFTKRSEQIIIGLIATEIVISLTDMHGVASLDKLRLLASGAAAAVGLGGGGPV